MIQKDFYINSWPINGQYMDPELRNAMCVLYLVLRALGTVEDDMNIPADTKVPILENFHRHIYDADFHFSCGKKHHKVLMDQFHHVSTALLELKKSYQESIEETTKIMGAGMAKFILKEVETVDDYNEYCHIVSGHPFIEISKQFHASNLMKVAPEYLCNSMGLFLQKIHIIQDFMEDMNEIPKPRVHWPRQIWRKYVDELEDLTCKANSEKALHCLNDMVTDALLHAENCLEYISTFLDPNVFRAMGILLIIGIGTLASCYNNNKFFRGSAKKISFALAAKAIEGSKTMSGVYGVFYDFSSMLRTKISDGDPNATKTLSCVDAIQKVCGSSFSLDHSISNLEIGVEGKGYDQVQEGESPLVLEQVNPYSLVADELSLIGNRLREMVAVEVPKLASAAEYFFELGVEGKRFRPTVLLLMASALHVSTLPESVPDDLNRSPIDVRKRQQCMAEITEMIHVASLLHDDVLDDADTRRGVPSLNVRMGNKLSVLAGDFLLSRACVALSSLKDFEVGTLMATVVEHLVTGEIMQMTSTLQRRYGMDQYMEKTYYKTASLIANSCKAIALLANQSTEVAVLAYNYGRNLGLAFQLIDDILDFTGSLDSLGKASLSDIHLGVVTAPILFAIQEYPQLEEIINRGFDDAANVDLALEYLRKSRGIQRAIELAIEHAGLAASAIDSLPGTDDENVRISRRALVDLTHMVVTRII
ncbi:hypothetical protein MKW94_026596 [Papaver nudicaule]|uniref:Uncharacterized protein n=1 Tax=Papaver nudicaule TaxID=74823 RepID=A0AA41UWQ1_PAPNU|nr:hypothetical protein [Papaver nudicaule]